jgi:hypothetical protein
LNLVVSRVTPLVSEKGCTVIEGNLIGVGAEAASPPAHGESGDNSGPSGTAGGGSEAGVVPGELMQIAAV